MKQKFVDKFNSGYLVDSSTDCWIWQKGKTSSGYGVIYIDKSQFTVHRFSYLIHKGKISEGNVIRHKCDNKLCCNPEHLLSGTQLDNIRDMWDRDRQNRSHGDDNSISKLTSKQVQEIYLRSNEESLMDLSEEYKISIGAISAIRNGSNWNRVTSKLNHVILNKSKKLTENSVKEIFKRATNGENHNLLASEYGVSQATVSRIKLGDSWKHLNLNRGNRNG